MRGKSIEAHTQKSFPSASSVFYVVEESKLNYTAKLKFFQPTKQSARKDHLTWETKKWI